MRRFVVTTLMFVFIQSNFVLCLAQSNDAKRCLQVLESSLVDFYLPSVDPKHGGYFEILDAKGNFAPSDKFLTLQARQLWFFSTLAVKDIRREESLAAAHSGYEFLTENFFDAKNGGYFAKVSAAGDAIDTRKHVYPNAFVIYGLVDYYRATGQAEALGKAQQLFRTLEKHAYDREHGGYQEFFYEDWRLITDPEESGYVGAINTKTYNSHLHILEAFARLYRETKNELLADRLRELVQINVRRVKHSEYPCNIDGWTRSWEMIPTPRNVRASYGHDVECAWLVLDACESLGQKELEGIESIDRWARRICDFAIKHGYDTENGGFYSSGEPGKASDDRRKIWWVQTEALVAMLTMHQITGEDKYRKIFDRCLEFTLDHHIAPEGGWWDTLEEDGSVGRKKVRTSMWQGAYHNGRALLNCAKILESGTR